MNLQRLWCVLVIIAFSMPVFAAEVAPGDIIDSFDDFNNPAGGGPNWVEVEGGGWASYIEQSDVNREGTGSMEIDFTQYVTQVYMCETFRTYDPNLDCNNWENLAITLWVWTGDPCDSRRGTLDSRLTTIVLTDSNFTSYDPGVTPWPHWEGNMGRFAVPPLLNVGWNKVIAPLRNFRWTRDPHNGQSADPPFQVAGSNVDPNTEVDWKNITSIGLFTTTEHNEASTYADNNAIYIDDMRFEAAPDPCSRPYQLVSFDNIWDELWEETHRGPFSVQFMLQNPNVAPYIPPLEGGSMLIDYNTNPDGTGTEDVCSLWDLTPKMPLIPALDFDDGNDWAITVWVWSDLPNAYGTLSDDSYLWEIALHDAGGNRGFYRVPRQDWDAGTGWTKVTARIDEFLWHSTHAGAVGSLATMTASQANLEAIIALELWAMDYVNHGNDIYFDDLRIEPAVEALSEAVVYNADYGTINVDGLTTDWDTLVDSDIIDFNLNDPNIKGWPMGDLHVQYRLAWDSNYIYILVEEQPGDDYGWEADDRADLWSGTLNYAGTYYDSLALNFDFTNDKLPGIDMHMSLYLILGFDSDERTDLMVSFGDPTMAVMRRFTHWPPLIVGGAVATKGTWTSSTETTRVIEAKLSWATLEDEIASWYQPDPNLLAAVKPGFIFGCDPHLQDDDDDPAAYDATHGLAWYSGRDNVIGWPQGNYRWPTGRDKYSTDIRLVYSAGDLDFDGDVNFVDYAQFAAEWDETDCNNLNDFCNGADLLIPMDGDVDLEDLGRFALRWLL